MRAGRRRMRRVLVVDDDPEILEVASAILREYEYVVETAVNGAEALERVKHARFDAVVLDLTMPVMDGATFLTACRATPAFKRLPIVVASAMHDAETRVMALGADAFLAKPFRVQSLRAVLQRLENAAA